MTHLHVYNTDSLEVIATIVGESYEAVMQKAKELNFEGTDEHGWWFGQCASHSQSELPKLTEQTEVIGV